MYEGTYSHKLRHAAASLTGHSGVRCRRVPLLLGAVPMKRRRVPCRCTAETRRAAMPPSLNRHQLSIAEQRALLLLSSGLSLRRLCLEIVPFSGRAATKLFFLVKQLQNQGGCIIEAAASVVNF